MAHQGYQPVDRYMEAWKLLARRWTWRPVYDDNDVLVGVLIPSRSEPGTYWRVDLATLSCGCPDFRFRQAARGELCAHGRATGLAMTLKSHGWTVEHIVDLAEQMVAGL